jgi:large subunit ribosomal protein L20
MARVKRGPHRKEKRKKVLKLAKGYYGKKRNAYRIAQQAVDRALRFAYRDRRQKKRQFRSLWIVRINAASRENGLSYNRLISGLRKAGLELNRKVLSEIAVFDPDGFAAIVEVAKDALGDEAGLKVRPPTERSKRPEPRTAEAPAAKPAPKKKAAPKKVEEKPKKVEEKPKKVAPKPKKVEEKPKKAAPKPKKAEAKPKKAEVKKPEPKKAEQKPAAKPAAKPAKKAEAAAPSKSELQSMTVPELKKLAGERGISESDVEGSGANGNVIKADWVKALSK